MDLGLKDKRVVITASSGGIGRSVAATFLEEGAKVLINGRNADRLEAAVSELSGKYGAGKVIGVAGDATKPETVDRIVSETESRWGAADIVIPCAGTGKPVSSDRLDITEWEHMMDANAYAPVMLIRKCIPLLKMGKDPNIVLISSVVAVGRSSAPVAYAAAKGALLTLTSYLAGMYPDTCIRVNAIVPGNVYFEGGRWEELKNADPQGTDDYIRANVPMNRFATPQEIADSVVFLASARSSFSNGAVLVVDGGQNRSI